MKRKFAVLAGSTVAAMGLSQQAQAQNNITETQATVGSSWAGTPVFQTGAGPETDSGGTTPESDGSPNWSSGSGGGTSGTAGFGALGEAFEVSTAGALSTIQLVMSGNSQAFNVELYNLGTAPANYPGPVGNTSSPAIPITQVTAANNLLSTGDTFTLGSSANVSLVTLTFGGADATQVLSPGNVYLLSLDPTSAAGGTTFWLRGGFTDAAYNTGEGMNTDSSSNALAYQNFEGKTTIRDFDTAVTEVPEPSSLAVISVGALLGTSRVRRRKA